MSAGVLAGLRILDFSTMLPGPLASLMLAQAGAEVVKVEPPGGEAGRADPAVFEMLNRGKRSIAIDLKRDRERLLPLVATAGVLIEQFRPGVMARLGLEEGVVRAVNPGVVYVSINGYGSTGPDALRPGHDLTYSAESGLLSLNADAAGTPVVPAALAADIGSSQRAVSNILLALLRRERTGEGARIEIDMLAGTFPFLVEALAHARTGRTPAPGYSPSTGSWARYNLYRTSDGRQLAVACAEQKFWDAFCAITSLPGDAGRDAVAACLGTATADAWMGRFAGADVCVSKVLSVTEALGTPRMAERMTAAGGLPCLFGADLGGAPLTDCAPELGEANGMLA